MNYQINHVKQMIDAIGKDTIVIAMEEFCELGQQASKVYRGKENTDALAEEIADALIGIELLMAQSGDTPEWVQKWINFKEERTLSKIEVGSFK